MRGATLRAEGLAFHYRRGFHLGPVTLEVPVGEVVALIGPNGAGKTTLLRLLAGLLHPRQGKVLLSGLPATRRRLQQVVAFAPTDPAFPARVTVGELLRFRAHHLGVPWEPAAQALEETLGRPLTVYPHRLSRGQRLQVVLALTLLGSPAAILADEPWAGLDPLAQDAVLERLARERQQAAVLVSSHDLGHLAQVAQRFAFLHEGQLRFCGTLEEVAEAVGGRAEPAEALKRMFAAVVGGKIR